MSPEPHTSVIDVALLWRLHDVADAATEVPLEYQPPRLRAALATLVSLRPQGDLEVRGP